jgi:endonuclease-8
VPEGDSIHRIANRLSPLVGERLEHVTTQGLVRDIAGATVTAVGAHGKHLVIDLDSGAQIRVHLGMNGRFRPLTRAEGETTLSRMSPGRASLALVVDRAVYLWVQARTVEITQRRAPMRGMAVASLGPDILAPEFDLDAAAARAAGNPTRTISDVLLDQRVVAGIGNIWKSESLFAAKVDPRTRVAALAPEQLVAIYRAAREKMQGSVRGGLSPSEPVGGDRYAVYSRTGQPCRVCATPIDAYRLGDPPRWTWSCPRCQVLP